ncbi:heterokaryon incompatibility protein-domain-containing protein [Podospora conica]|nr:heterokaryon incompatibility protein-domain-containing protein [Schizothecium conicum]
MEAAISLYRPLPLSSPAIKPQIRLLHVQPSSNLDHPIECSLSVHDLNKFLDFTALSYEWGRPPKQTAAKPTVQINSLWTLEIQANLNKALRHLRHPDKVLIIWVDAVCINQNDNAEKGQQVGLMADIYGSASQTYVWLGTSADGSDLAMTTMRKVGQSMLKEENGTSPRQQFEDLTKNAAAGEWHLHSPEELQRLAPDLIQEYIPNASFCAIECRKLLSRSYWTRMWVQQEVVLSPSPVICCGAEMVDWDTFEASIVFINLLKHHAIYGVASRYNFRQGMTNLDLQSSLTYGNFKEDNPDNELFPQWTESERKNYDTLSQGWTYDVGALRRLRNRWLRDRASSPDGLSLIRVISEAHAGDIRHQLSNHHDRVYGLVGMASDIPRLERFGFQITYSLSCSESYANIARAIIMAGDVDLLAMSNINKLEKMPSWVPDWRTPMHMPRGGYPWETKFCATRDLQGPSNISVHAEWDDPLVLEGCIIDQVIDTQQPWRPGDIGCRVQSRLTQGYLLDVSKTLITSDDRQRKSNRWIYKKETQSEGALWRVPVADQHQGAAEPGKESDYLNQGYLGVMKDVDRGFLSDTRMWPLFRKFLFNVELEGFPDPVGMKPPPHIVESAAEFRVKDSYYNLMKRQSGTRPFVGNLGYLGLVPDSTEPGDIVVIFKNAKFPYVLRRRIDGKHAEQYELLGEAYVHGIMYGEFLSGNPEFVQFELV